tara:strand:- start:76 stop:594 length:519 start_codon:yes stop_codon:yes gene_type:complete
MQLKYDNLEEYIKRHGNLLIKALKHEINRERETRRAINYTGELANSFTLVEEKTLDEYTINIKGLERYKRFMPNDNTTVVASVNDIADWLERKLNFKGSIQELFKSAEGITDALAARGYSQSSKVNFVSEAIEKKREQFKPARAVVKDIKNQILVILKEAGIETEGKKITFS